MGDTAVPVRGEPHCEHEAEARELRDRVLVLQEQLEDAHTMLDGVVAITAPHRTGRRGESPRAGCR